MNRSLTTLLAVLPLLCLSAVAQADPTQQWRCSTDALSASASRMRIEWARRCALTTNTGGPNSYIASTKAFDQTFNWAKDYREINTARAYSGNSNQYSVNYYYAYSMYETSPIYTVFQETGGATAGYYKWSHTMLRLRPLYPSFETTPVAGGGTQLFPHPTVANCQLYTDKNGLSPWAGSFYVTAYCEAFTTALVNGTALGAQTGAAGSARYYSLDVPAGTRQLVFEISGGTGDADLYVQSGASPTLTSYVCRPMRAGNSERCVVTNPSAGTWFASLNGWSDFSGVSITGRLVP